MPISVRKVSLIIFSLILLIGVGVLLWNRMYNSKTTPQSFLVVSTEEEISPSPTQTPSQTEENNVHSPDGKMNLSMEKITSGDSSTYTITVSDIPQTIQKTVYTKTLPNSQTLTLSPNSWSPNNSYFFLKELGSGSSPAVYVFKANGESFSDTQPYIDVLPIFNAKGTGNNLKDVTGWDSNTLLHVFSETQTGNKGPNYWFEIPSGGVIQLAH